MTDEVRRQLINMFGPAAPVMDMDTCAKVFYKPLKDCSDSAWLPIGWEYHQAMLFVKAQEPKDSMLYNTMDGQPEVLLSAQSYVNMGALSKELQTKIREELGLRQKAELAGFESVK